MWKFNQLMGEKKLRLEYLHYIHGFCFRESLLETKEEANRCAYTYVFS